ncbi:hypothetical protein MIND_00214800 [Mycena indigotica]|uniref:Uncharacterized protein n=1 Tax=Mycena indigotica TaxID=2126181 RepID=A0A8H6T5A3_9AGAR|nr:uncharacterized protein MIND_00214800 [Mycena indigotica]KAF7312028.1 hypothetical protein MIND_00214800 [Mycena indigotica]
MRLPILPALVSTIALVNARVVQQRTVSSNHGTITSPSTGTLVSNVGGDAIPFAYSDSNWCHNGYSTTTAWLLDYEPTTANIDAATGLPSNPIYQFGTYLIPNFGLPPLSGSNPPPPSTLTTPALAPAYASGRSLYLAVIETATACPPGVNIPPQYGVTSVKLVVA